MRNAFQGGFAPLAFLFWLLAGVILSGCSDEERDMFEPDPLVDLENQFETNILWQTSVGDGTTDKTVKLAPVFAYDKIFVADNSGHVAAVDPDNGKIIWSVNLDAEIGGGPAIASNLLAIGTQKGEVVLMDAADGSIKWRRSVQSEIVSSPAIGEGHVVVNSIDGKITAFSLEGGEQKWFYDQSIPSLTLRGNSTPIIAGGGAITGFANGKLAVFLLENGQLAWEKTITAPTGSSEIQRLVDVDIRPQLVGSGIYVAAYNGNLAYLNASNGETIWQRELSTFQELTVSDLLLLVTHENSHVSAVNAQNGTILWTQKQLNRRLLTAPAALGDYVVVADFEGYLHWMNRIDGLMVSRVHLDSDGISAAPLVVNDRIILLTHSGELVAVTKK